MTSWDRNLYYHPEKSGLTTVGEVEWSEPSWRRSSSDRGAEEPLCGVDVHLGPDGDAMSWSDWVGIAAVALGSVAVVAMRLWLRRETRKNRAELAVAYRYLARSSRYAGLIDYADELERKAVELETP